MIFARVSSKPLAIVNFNSHQMAHTATNTSNPRLPKTNSDSRRKRPPRVNKRKHLSLSLVTYDSVQQTLACSLQHVQIIVFTSMINTHTHIRIFDRKRGIKVTFLVHVHFFIFLFFSPDNVNDAKLAFTQRCQRCKTSVCNLLPLLCNFLWASIFTISNLH